MVARLIDLHPDDREHRRHLITQLIDLRHDARRSQTAVAQAIGTSNNALSFFERQPPRAGRNQYNPYLRFVQAYARAVSHRLDFTIVGLPHVDDATADAYTAMAVNAADPTIADTFLSSALLAQLTAIRRHVGWTQQTLADAIGCHESAIQQLEADRYLTAHLSTYQKYTRGIGGILTCHLQPVHVSDLGAAA